MEHRLIIDNLLLEVTRACNMRCSHCCRGEPQEIVMRNSIIYKTFRNIDRVNTLVLTGGEPGLVPWVISSIADRIETNKIEIGSFYIATNGMLHSFYKDFMHSVLRLWLLCDDKEMCSIQLSNSPFHLPTVIERFSDHPYMAFKFASLKYNTPAYDTYLINQGRSRKLKSSPSRPITKRAPFVDEIKFDDVYDAAHHDTTCIMGEFYVNVHGDIIEGCDWSYNSQPKHKVGSILDSIPITEVVQRLTERRKKTVEG